MHRLWCDDLIAVAGQHPDAGRGSFAKEQILRATQKITHSRALFCPLGHVGDLVDLAAGGLGGHLGELALHIAQLARQQAGQLERVGGRTKTQQLVKAQGHGGGLHQPRPGQHLVKYHVLPAGRVRLLGQPAQLNGDVGRLVAHRARLGACAAGQTTVHLLDEIVVDLYLAVQQLARQEHPAARAVGLTQSLSVGRAGIQARATTNAIKVFVNVWDLEIRGMDLGVELSYSLILSRILGYDGQRQQGMGDH